MGLEGIQWPVVEIGQMSARALQNFKAGGRITHRIEACLVHFKNEGQTILGFKSHELG